MKHSVSLFIFRRDLRLHDNTALNAALENSKKVIPCFIYDPRQVTSRNEYRSEHALQFMDESLQDLEKQLKAINAKLYFFYGLPHEIIKQVLYDHPVDAVYLNKDYTPFSIQRDAKIKKNCLALNKDFYEFDDVLLNAPGIVQKKMEHLLACLLLTTNKL